jgi:tRNA A-37 threonylcarbamoyl transferase component Bud32
VSCPAPERLEAFARGDGTSAELKETAEHVAGCAACTAAVNVLKGKALGAPDTRSVNGDENPTRDQHGARPADVGEIFGPVPTPERIGPYVLFEQLGQGGMGAVYTAYHPELDRKVAIKLLRSDYEGDGSSGQARLLREAQAMAKLAHPNVVAVYDAGTHDNKVYLVMERIEGTTLRAWLEEKPRGWREVVGAFVQAGRGLAAAHAVGLVHRDFKPANVLVGKDGRVRVTDFGLARPTGTASAPELAAVEQNAAEGLRAFSEPITRAGAILGTPAYMAPEQLFGRPADARTDQFSFCVCLYEALYTERPYDGRPDPLTMVKVKDAPAGRSVPRFVRQALLKGLTIPPDGRFASMDALLAALGRDPRRAVLLAAGAAVALALLAGVSVVSARVARAPIAGCEELEHPLAGIWDDAAKQSLRTAFLTTHDPAAEVNATGSSRQLDAYVVGWQSALRSTCTRAATARGDETVLLELACLSRQKMQLQALVDVLQHPEAETVANAINAIASLFPPSRCADPRVLAALPKPPSDPRVRTEVEALRLKIAAGTAQYNAGRPKVAVTSLEPVVDRARTLG